MLAGAAALAFTSWGCNAPGGTRSGQDDDPIDHAEPSATGGPVKTGTFEYAQDSVIVRFKAVAASERLRASVLAQVKGSFEDRDGDGICDLFTNIDKSGSLVRVDLDRSMSVEAALQTLRQDPAVLYAEPNYLLHASTIPNDTRFAELYGLHNTGQSAGTVDADIDAPEAWDSQTGSTGVVVAVIDTGIDFNHPDLAANVWTNPGEVAGNGLDDDGNGVVDDVHGFNAITRTGNSLDDNDHGSHCAGTIGAIGNNNVGVAGVNWTTSMMAVKFLGFNGSGTTADAIAGINYVLGRKAAGVNVRVLSNSWGGGAFSQALADAITATNTAGMLFVAAAGNAGTNNDNTPSYPASYDLPNVISVAATERNDALWVSSNFGATSVDLAAPGVNILSTTRNNTYSVFSGTSMATPHVAGAAALVLAANGTLTTAEVKELLLTTGDPKPSLAGKTVTGRRLNVANALAAAGPPLPHFDLVAAPAARTIAAGTSTTYSADLTPIAGFTGNAELTVTSVPALTATITATPTSVAVPGSSTITVATTAATTPGVYALTITGTAGPVSKSRVVSLRVRPFGTTELSFPSTDTPLAIPSGPTAGINSIINVAQPIAVQEVLVDLNITHTWIGDLLVTLRSPQGTTVVLHNRAGGSADNIHQTYTLPVEFAGQQGLGAWTLHVDDNFTSDTGTLDSWTLRIIGVPTAPSFNVSAAPAAQTVVQGATASYAIAVSPAGTFPGTVALSATSQPALAASISFEPSSVTAPGTSTLSIATGCATAPGTYAVTVTGTSGDIIKTTQLALTVYPFGAASLSYPSGDTPLAIPDNNSTGVTSTITVPDAVSVLELSAEVHLVHSWIGDLSVKLIGPAGQVVTLHNRAGGGTRNLDQTYAVTAFNGLSTQGAWRLQVTDGAAGLAGTLTSWTLRAVGSAGPQPPTSAFTYAATRLSVAFTDASTDTGCGGGGIVSWGWAFGDGTTSTAQHPTHVYAASGTYTATLTVTDTDGLTASSAQAVTVSRPAPVLAIERVLRNRATYEFSVDLTWSGADGSYVDLKRNNLLADIATNDGVQRDVFRRYETSFSWLICEQFSTFCSNEVSVVFGTSLDTATVVTTAPGGESTSYAVPIVEVKDPGSPAAPSESPSAAPVLTIERVLRNRAAWEFAVDLTWTGAPGTLVDLKRNGLLVDIPTNDGAQRDLFRRYETTFLWQLCQQFSGNCSNEVGVILGNSLGDQATIVTRGRDGASISYVVPIVDVK